MCQEDCWLVYLARLPELEGSFLLMCPEKFKSCLRIVWYDQLFFGRRGTNRPNEVDSRSSSLLDAILDPTDSDVVAELICHLKTSSFVAILEWEQNHKDAKRHPHSPCLRFWRVLSEVHHILQKLSLLLFGQLLCNLKQILSFLLLSLYFHCLLVLLLYFHCFHLLTQYFHCCFFLLTLYFHLGKLILKLFSEALRWLWG